MSAGREEEALLTREEEEYVREAFQRLTRLERYNREAINEHHFVDIFLQEVSPHISRKLGRAIWYAIAGDAYNVNEDRFVRLLAIARRGSMIDKLSFALNISARFDPGPSDLGPSTMYSRDHWHAPPALPTSRSVTALLRHLGQDGLIRMHYPHEKGKHKEEITRRKRYKDHDQSSPFSSEDEASDLYEPVPLRSNDLASILGLYNIYDEICIRDFEPVLSDYHLMHQEDQQQSQEDIVQDDEVLEEERRLSSDDDENDKNMAETTHRYDDTMIEEEEQDRDQEEDEDSRLSSNDGIQERRRSTKDPRDLPYARTNNNNTTTNLRKPVSIVAPRRNIYTNQQQQYYRNARQQEQQHRTSSSSSYQYTANNHVYHRRDMNSTDLQVLDQILRALTNIVTNCLDGWSVPAPTDDRSSSNTSATKHAPEMLKAQNEQNSSEEDEGPARRRQRTALAALRATTPELGLPDMNSDTGVHTLLAAAGHETESVDDLYNSRAPKHRRRSSSRDDEQQQQTSALQARAPKAEENILLEMLFNTIRDSSFSAAVDVDAIVEFMARPRLNWRQETIGREPCEVAEYNTSLKTDETQQGPAYLSREAARRLFFRLLDTNGSGVAHREHFINALSSACGTLSPEKIQYEHEICTQILLVPPGTLRTCLEDLIHVRLRIRPPLGRSCEKRVVQRYLSRRYIGPSQPFLRPNEEFRALPSYWLELWTTYLNNDHTDRASIPPIDGRSIIWPEPREELLYNSDKYDYTSLEIDARSLALRPDVELGKDFELFPALLYHALASWYTTINNSIQTIARVARHPPTQQAHNTNHTSAILTLRPPRCIIWYKPEERPPIYIACEADETIEDVVKRAYDIIFNASPPQRTLAANTSRNTNGRRRRQHQNSPAGFQPNTLAPIPKDRLRALITRSFIRDLYFQQMVHQSESEPVRTPDKYTPIYRRSTETEADHICFLEHLCVTYDGAAPTRASYMDKQTSTHSQQWRSTVAAVMRERDLFYMQREEDGSNSLTADTKGDEAPTRGPSVGKDDFTADDKKDEDRNDEKQPDDAGLEEKHPIFAQEDVHQDKEDIPDAELIANTHQEQQRRRHQQNEFIPKVVQRIIMSNDVTLEILLIEEDDDPEPLVQPQAHRNEVLPAPAATTNYVVPRGIKGEVGLRNLGNTCYMNSVLQALAHVPPLRLYFASGEFCYDINTESKFGADGKLAASFGELVYQLSVSEEGIIPDAFKRVLGAWDHTFSGYSQQDASEFFIKFFEGLGEDLNRVVDKPYLENPDVESDPDAPISPQETAKLEPRVARECWTNHAHLREDHPITALFGGQLRREIYCNQDERERSIGFDAFSSLTVPLYGDDQAAGTTHSDTFDIRCRIRFARQRVWPLDVVARVPLDGTIFDVLKACAKCKLDSDSIYNKPELQDHRYYPRKNHFRSIPHSAFEPVGRREHEYIHKKTNGVNPGLPGGSSLAFGSQGGQDDAQNTDESYVTPLRVENLVAMVPFTLPPSNNNEKFIDATGRILPLNMRVRENLLYCCFAVNQQHRLEIHEVIPEIIAEPTPTSKENSQAEDEDNNIFSPEVAAEVGNSSICPAALRTLTEIEYYFMDSSRLCFLGEPFLVRVVAGVTTGAMLRRNIWEHVRPWMDSVPLDDSRDKLCSDLFELRLCSRQGSPEEIRGKHSIVGSEMLLPEAGYRIADDDTILMHHHDDFDGCSFIVDVPRAARFRFNFRVMNFCMTHISCAPPPPKPPIALESCLRSFCAPEIVTKYSKAQTRRNNGEYTEAPHTNKVTISRAPPFLALILKRFMVTERGRKRKLSDRVAFPIHGLDLSEFMSARPSSNGATAKATSPVKKEEHDAQGVKVNENSMIDEQCSVLDTKVATSASLSTIAAQEFTAIDASEVINNRMDVGTPNGEARAVETESTSGLAVDEEERDNELDIPPIYDLIAVVNHFGGLEHGHYTCFARRVDNSGWLEFDDKRVEKIEMSEVCDDPAAYVLLYARRDTHVEDPLGYIRQRFDRVRKDSLDIEALLRPPAPPPPGAVAPRHQAPIVSGPSAIIENNTTSMAAAHPTVQALRRGISQMPQNQTQLAPVPELSTRNEPGALAVSAPVCPPSRNHMNSQDIVLGPSSPVDTNRDTEYHGPVHENNYSADSFYNNKSPLHSTGLEDNDEVHSSSPQLNYLDHLSRNRLKRHDDTDDQRDEDDDDHRVPSDDDVEEDDDDDPHSTTLYYPDNNSVDNGRKHMIERFDKFFPGGGQDRTQDQYGIGGYEADGDNFDGIEAEDMNGVEEDDDDDDIIDDEDDIDEIDAKMHDSLPA